MSFCMTFCITTCQSEKSTLEIVEKFLTFFIFLIFFYKNINQEHNLGTARLYLWIIHHSLVHLAKNVC